MKKIKFTQEQFIENCKKAHGNKYDYSKAIYQKCDVPVIIICPEHGEFKQLPIKHCNNRQGCPICSGNIKKTTNEIIKEFKAIHNNKYDYSKVKYVNTHTKVKIICPEHGEFEQTPHNHLIWGCDLCSGTKKLTTEEFIKRAKRVHGDFYDYSKVNYKGSFKEVIIICPKHGEFKQIARKHTYSKHGCPKCKLSKGEQKIICFLNENHIEFISQKKFVGCKDKRMLPFDFYLPKTKVCIEFDGEQHYVPKQFFGGEIGLKNRLKKDRIKTEFCKNKNIKLIRIKYNENIENILKKAIL